MTTEEDQRVQDAPAPPAAYVPNLACRCKGYGSVTIVIPMGPGATLAKSVPCPACSPTQPAGSINP